MKGNASKSTLQEIQGPVKSCHLSETYRVMELEVQQINLLKGSSLFESLTRTQELLALRASLGSFCASFSQASNMQVTEGQNQCSEGTIPQTPALIAITCFPA